MTLAAGEGLTKMIIDTETGRTLGLGIVGRHTEGMISEGALAEDLALTIHPHPSLSETVGEAADVFLGTVTHLLPKKR